MKYKHNLEIRNETDKNEIFYKFKDAIYDFILREINTYKFNLELLVVFREIDKEKKFINEEMLNGGTTIIDDRYAIIINIKSLELMLDDGGFDFALTVYHELCHLYDLFQIMHNRYLSINPLYQSYKTYKDFAISKGWMFWTEFRAYFLTYKNFQEGYDCPTLLHIVQGYEELKAQFEKIKLIGSFETEEFKTMLYNFTNHIEDFTYFTAKYLAGITFCDPKNRVCDEKTQESDAYEKVHEIFTGALKKIRPLLHNIYGMGMAKKLYKLGDYILEHIYAEFNILPVNCEGQILFAYCE